jgi:hypothetical protein
MVLGHNTEERLWKMCMVKDREVYYLHCHKPVIHHHLFGKKVSTDCGLILIAELLIHILVHERGLPNSVSVEIEESDEQT